MTFDEQRAKEFAALGNHLDSIAASGSLNQPDTTAALAICATLSSCSTDQQVSRCALYKALSCGGPSRGTGAV